MAVTVTVDLRKDGNRFMAGTVTLDASNPTPVDLSAYMSRLNCGVAQVSGTGAPGDDPNLVTTNVTAASALLDIYAWKHIDTVSDPTLVASTDNARVVDWFALGVALPRKGS